MGKDTNMSLALDRPFKVHIAPSGETETSESGLNIVVIFTNVNATTVALQTAGALAQSLGARITLVYPQVVPYPLPLTSPPVLLEFQERRLREIASACPVDIRVQLYLCRDGLETLGNVLEPRSIIVVGGRRRWWPTREQKLVHQLQKKHEVVFAEMREISVGGADLSPASR
jgi:hypothetical protein